jgi:hypothetical protein
MIAEFIKKSNFCFDINNADPESDYIITFPQMAQIPSWHDCLKPEFNSLVRFILYLYDKGSAFREKFRDFEVRKQNAIIEAGAEGLGLEEYSDEVIVMISDFLRYQNDKLWTLICINESIFQEYNEILMTKLDKVNNDKDLITAVTTKEKVREYMDKTRRDLETYLTEFYADDKQAEEKHQKMVRFSPESISKKKSMNIG